MHNGWAEGLARSYIEGSDRAVVAGGRDPRAAGAEVGRQARRRAGVDDGRAPGARAPESGRAVCARREQRAAVPRVLDRVHRSHMALQATQLVRGDAGLVEGSLRLGGRPRRVRRRRARRCAVGRWRGRRRPPRGPAARDCAWSRRAHGEHRRHGRRHREATSARPPPDARQSHPPSAPVLSHVLADELVLGTPMERGGDISSDRIAEPRISRRDRCSPARAPRRGQRTGAPRRRRRDSARRGAVGASKSEVAGSRVPERSGLRSG